MRPPSNRHLRPLGRSNKFHLRYRGVTVCFLIAELAVLNVSETIYNALIILDLPDWTGLREEASGHALVDRHRNLDAVDLGCICPEQFAFGYAERTREEWRRRSLKRLVRNRSEATPTSKAISKMLRRRRPPRLSIQAGIVRISPTDLARP
jgi:hypothetical protein